MTISTSCLVVGDRVRKRLGSRVGTVIWILGYYAAVRWDARPGESAMVDPHDLVRLDRTDPISQEAA